MLAFAQLAEAVAATTKKTEKVRLVAEYLRTQQVDEAAQAAIFLSGRAFPMWEERTLQVGGTSLWRALAEVSGKPEVSLTAAYRRHGCRVLARRAITWALDERRLPAWL